MTTLPELRDRVNRKAFCLPIDVRKHSRTREEADCFLVAIGFGKASRLPVVLTTASRWLPDTKRLPESFLGIVRISLKTTSLFVSKPVLRYSEGPDGLAARSGPSEYLRTGLGGFNLSCPLKLVPPENINFRSRKDRQFDEEAIFG
jgi:hypothetical protein